MSAVFASATPSSKVTLADEYISAGVCIFLGLVQLGFDIKLFIKLLVSDFTLFPDSEPRQLLGTQRSFQVEPPLVSLCLAVVSCPRLFVVHVALLCPVRILYLCDHQ